MFYGINPTAGDPGYVDGNINTLFTYTQALGTTFGTATANATYFKFTGLTASEVSFSVSQQGGDNPALSGFQIVEVILPPTSLPVPEPSGLILLGAGIAGLSVLRKRNRRAVCEAPPKNRETNSDIPTSAAAHGSGDC